MDSVPLENVGFCRSSVLAEAQKPRWMLAMPGKGSDEVRTNLLQGLPCSSTHSQCGEVEVAGTLPTTESPVEQ